LTIRSLLSFPNLHFRTGRISRQRLLISRAGNRRDDLRVNVIAQRQDQKDEEVPSNFHARMIVQNVGRDI